MKDVPIPDSDRLTVAYFYGCSANHFEPDLGELVIAVLEQLGCEVLVPGPSCCGLALQTNSQFQSARAHANRITEALAGYVEQAIPIIGTSAACVLELKRGYRNVLDLRGRDIEALACGVYDLFEWVREALWQRLSSMDLAAIEATVLYHPSCQLMGQCIGAPALEVLRQIPALDLRIARSECCGGAGSYALKQETYPVALRVGDALFAHIEEIRPTWVLSDSESCRWWIEHHTGVPTKHPIEMLAMAMRLRFP